MLRIRLTRTGKKHAPAYRIIVAKQRSKRDGKYIDLLGHYHPSHNPVLFKLDLPRMKEWVTKGAQISDGVKKILEQQKIAYQ